MADEAPEKDVFEPLHGNRFRFLCHRDMDCFTRCCAGLNLVLMPYDILRLKHRLGISSEEFLNAYTEMRFDRHPRFPMVVLKMKDEEGKRCPFVRSEGCAVYEDRPSACRIYPIGRAAMNPGSTGGPQEKYFVVREEHCLGFQESHDWTIEKWVTDQGLKEYDGMNSAWLDIVTSTQRWGRLLTLPRETPQGPPDACPQALDQKRAPRRRGRPEAGRRPGPSPGGSGEGPTGHGLLVWPPASRQAHGQRPALRHARGHRGPPYPALGHGLAPHQPGNGRSVEVRVTDRGPFIPGRQVDLSYSAAQKLGVVKAGVSRLYLEQS